MKPHALLLAASLSLVLTPFRSAPAAVIASYSAGTTSPAPNPETLNWTLSGNYAEEPNAVIPGPGEETINGKTWQYWDISNSGPGKKSGFSALYRMNLQASDFSHANGWTATTVVRVESAATTFNAAYFQVADGANHWEVSFIKNATDGSSINYRSLAENLNVLSTVDTGADYMTVQLYYNPDTKAVSFYLNGVQLGTPLSHTGAVAATSSQLYVRWGDNAGSPTAVRTISHWNAVQLESGFAVVPEPATAAMLLGGGAIALILRRRLPGRKALS